jgi:hypothetical protein
MRNRQVGPDAVILAEVVAQTTYKPGWTFELREIDRGQGCQGLTLIVQAQVPDSCNEGQTIGFAHLFPVLPAAYNRKAWIGWVLECVRMVEKHETLEWFRVNGEQVCFPSHAPGDNPYAVHWVRGSDEAFAAAAPWNGDSVSDEHFTEA